MKKLLSIFLMALALAACQKRETSVESTETIAPAAPQPGTAAGDTAEALTQTVDVETGRSEAEGGGLTSPNPPVRTGSAPPATTTTNTTTTTTATNTTTTTTASTTTR
jgi:hypothetical protein